MSVALTRPDSRPDGVSRDDATESRVAAVVDRIIERIAAGRLAAGARVAESLIEREFGASRYTVREALRVLVTQGVLEKVPHSGCRVTRFDEARLHQIYTARLQVELLALPDAIAACNADPALLDRLDDALVYLAAAAASGADTRYAEADLAFHRTVCRLSGNDIACRLWDTLLPHVRIVRAILGGRVADLPAHVAEHRALRDAIAGGNVTTAEAAWRAHMLRHLHEEGTRSHHSDVAAGAPPRAPEGMPLRHAAR